MSFAQINHGLLPWEEQIFHVLTTEPVAHGLAGVWLFRLFADYCASKFAAVGFAESVGLELLATGKDGVKTTIVCPYFINTGMFDGCQTK